MLENLHSLSGHTDRVWTLAWNPAGTILATSGADRVIRTWAINGAGLWDCASIITGTHNKSIRRLCWSPCGNYLASASFDSTVCISKRNNVDGTWSTVVNLEGHESEVKSIAWSHDGNFLASCGRDRTIWIWERATSAGDLESEDGDIDAAENWDCSDVKNDHTKDVKHIVWHPCHNILVSMSYDDSIKLFHKDQDDWKCFDTLLAHKSTVWSADFSPSGEYLVTCSDDKTIRIWKNHSHNSLPNVQANSWKSISVIQGYHSRAIYDVAWCPQTDLIASASGDNSIAIYRRDSTQIQDGGDLFICEQRYGDAHRSDVNTIAWNPRTPGLLASGGDDRCIKIWKYCDSVSKGTKAMSIVDEILKDLSQTSLGCQNASSPITTNTSDLNQKHDASEHSISFNVNSFNTLFKLIQNLQKLQSEMYLDQVRLKLAKLLDLNFSPGNPPPVRLSGLTFDATETDLTNGFYVDIIDDSETIRHKFKFVIDSDCDQSFFKLKLPRRSVKMVVVGDEMFLLEKTGDLYRIKSSGQSEFLLGHLFTFSDLQFVFDNTRKRLSYIISADRDEKIRITNYPKTFEVERYCFGHKNLLSRIFVVDEDKFVSVDQQGDVCVWCLSDLLRDKFKPLTPVRMESISDETSRKRVRLEQSEKA